MSMQLMCVPNQPYVLPPSDVDRMQEQIAKIKVFLKEIDAGTGTDSINRNLKDAVSQINEIIHLLDNANDFFKIGGFDLLPLLLAYHNTGVVAATAELIADLCQNNTFCQNKALDYNLMPKLIELMRNNSDSSVCIKALYALSCLCRHSEEALSQLEVSNALQVLLETIQRPDKRLRTKTAFFLSHLSSYKVFCNLLYDAGVIEVLINLLTIEEDFTSEYLLAALLAQVKTHKKSRLQCKMHEYNLKNILESKIEFYDSNEEYREAEEYCQKILDACFDDE